MTPRSTSWPWVRETFIPWDRHSLSCMPNGFLACNSVARFTHKTKRANVILFPTRRRRPDPFEPVPYDCAFHRIQSQNHGVWRTQKTTENKKLVLCHHKITFCPVDSRRLAHSVCVRRLVFVAWSRCTAATTLEMQLFNGLSAVTLRFSNEHLTGMLAFNCRVALQNRFRRGKRQFTTRRRCCAMPMRSRV